MNRLPIPICLLILTIAMMSGETIFAQSLEDRIKAVEQSSELDRIRQQSQSPQRAGATGASEAEQARKKAAEILETRRRILTMESKLIAPQRELKFDQVPADEAITAIARQVELPIVVNWRLLKARGLDPKTPISLQLENIATERALQLVIDQIEGGEQLVFEVTPWYVRIIDQASANRRTEMRVYAMDDMLLPRHRPELEPMIVVETGGPGAGGLHGGGTSHYETSQRGHDIRIGGKDGKVAADVRVGQRESSGTTTTGPGGTTSTHHETGGEVRVHTRDGKIGGRIDLSERSVQQHTGGSTWVTTQNVEVVPPALEAERMAHVIRNTIEPEIWRAHGGDIASIRASNGQLVVNAPIYIHRQIARPTAIFPGINAPIGYIDPQTPISR